MGSFFFWLLFFKLLLDRFPPEESAEQAIWQSFLDRNASSCGYFFTDEEPFAYVAQRGETDEATEDL